MACSEIRLASPQEYRLCYRSLGKGPQFQAYTPTGMLTGTVGLIINQSRFIPSRCYCAPAAAGADTVGQPFESTTVNNFELQYTHILYARRRIGRPLRRLDGNKSRNADQKLRQFLVCALAGGGNFFPRGMYIRHIRRLFKLFCILYSVHIGFRAFKAN